MASKVFCLSSIFSEPVMIMYFSVLGTGSWDEKLGGVRGLTMYKCHEEGNILFRTAGKN